MAKKTEETTPTPKEDAAKTDAKKKEEPKKEKEDPKKEDPKKKAFVKQFGEFWKNSILQLQGRALSSSDFDILYFDAA